MTAQRSYAYSTASDTGIRPSVRPRYTGSTETLQDIADFMRIADTAAMVLFGYVGYALRYGWMPLADQYFITLICGVLMFGLIANSCHLYHPSRVPSFKRQALRLAFAHGLTLLSLITLLFFVHTAGKFSRIWVGLWFAGAAASMLLMRWGLIRWTARKLQTGAFARRMILVGSVEKTQRVIASLRNDTANFNIIGVCPTDAHPTSELFFDAAPTAPHIPIVPSVAELAEHCRRFAVDEVIITSDLEYHPDAAAILSNMESLPCSVKYCIPGQFFGRPLADAGLLGHHPVMTMPVVTIFRKPLNNRDLLCKRLTDIAFSFTALCLFAPLMGVLALLIALDGQGKILFRQQRHGFGGNEFLILKFRSMQVVKTPESQVKQATRHDKRVTRIGALIRRFSLDELPQLINVLKGDMSLVGPRPHALSHNHYYQQRIASYAMRHRIKPGITGLAQVNGWRGETDTVEKMQKRVEHDLYYIENWSIWLDIKILVLTLFSVFNTRNAY